MTVLPPSVPILPRGETLGTKEDRRQPMSIWELPWLAAWAYISRISKWPWDSVLPPKVCVFLQRDSVSLFSVGAGGTTGPAWTFPVAGGLQRGQVKGERWSHGYGLKSSCWLSLDMAVTRQERADIGLYQLQHLHWDVPVLSFVREKQGNWILIIYMSVFQVVFAICKVSQTWASWAMFSRKDYGCVKHYSRITSCAVRRWQLPRHFCFSSLTFPKRTAALPMVPCAREAVADIILPSLLTALQRGLLPGLLKQSRWREAALALASQQWAARSRAKHRNLGDPWCCIFSNTWTQ